MELLPHTTPAERSGRRRELGDRTFRRLRRAALLAPLALVVTIEGAHAILDGLVSPWVDRLLVASIALIAALVFYHLVFEQLEGLRHRVLRQNRELLGLHQAGLAVAAELALDSVLQTVVETAASLVGTRYGALSVIDEEGRIRSFLTTGVSPEVHRRIGDLPRGRGLLGVVLHEGHRLRLENLQQHARSAGFPAHHPPMRTLLAVPVLARGPYHGNLYLSEKLDGSAFSVDDEDTLVRFAAQAAVAIDNAHLHGQVRELGAARERIRIAHEMHDGLAQVLAYVNTKAQVVREYCRQEKIEEAKEHLEQLAQAARDCYSDVREQILELRTTSPGEPGGLVRAISEYTARWQEQSGIEVQLTVPESLELPPEVELQVLRIIQEALTNVRRHAGATSARIALERVDEQLRLLVADDGEGIGSVEAPAPSPGRGPRFGLATMRERAQAVGGTLALASSPGEGTRIEARLPLPSAPAR